MTAPATRPETKRPALPAAPAESLADRINAEHRAANEAAASAIEHARLAGELLLEAKASVAHGAWGAWLSVNFEGSERTAQAYMRIAKRWPEIRAAID